MSIFSEKSDSVRLANLPVLPDKSTFIHIAPIEYSCTDVHLLILYQQHTEKSIFNNQYLFTNGHFARIVHNSREIYSGRPDKFPSASTSARTLVHEHVFNKYPVSSGGVLYQYVGYCAD